MVFVIWDFDRKLLFFELMKDILCKNIKDKKKIMHYDD